MPNTCPIIIPLYSFLLLTGIIDVKKLKPLARLGYMDYSIVDSFFQMNRPKKK